MKYLCQCGKNGLVFLENREHNCIKHLRKANTLKIIGNAPEWASELFVKVCKDYGRGLPSTFIWKNRSGKYSSGVTRPTWYTSLKKTKAGKYVKVHHYGEVCVRAGSSEEDQRLVLLHETAHHLVSRAKTSRGQGHTMKFWKTAFELYDNYGVDMDYAYKREKGYKAKATPAYEQHMAKSTAV
jgi:hypothetical protein